MSAPKLHGYARVSTLDQEAGLSAQERDLWAAGVSSVALERASAVGERPVLEALIDTMAVDDTIVVTKLDRLARNVGHLCQLVERIKARGGRLRILALGLDTGTPTGTLMLNVLGSVAQFEREIMLERQREGIAKAKAAGKYKGRKPSVERGDVKASYRYLVDEQNWNPTAAIEEAATVHNLSVRQVQRIVRGK